MAVFQQKLGALGVSKMKIQKYAVASVSPLRD
jgi:hypothetical protein